MLGPSLNLKYLNFEAQPVSQPDFFVFLLRCDIGTVPFLLFHPALSDLKSSSARAAAAGLLFS